MEQDSYTVVDQARVTDAFKLSESPVGLNIKFEGGRNSCTVETVPPTPESPLAISNDLLQELLEDGAIERKD